VSDQPEMDVEVLASSLRDLLSGELKVGVGLLKVGGCLKREGRNKAWVIQGLRRWLDDAGEDAIPLLAAALGMGGIERLRAWLDKHPTSG
jgi:hypothetical protein